MTEAEKKYYVDTVAGVQGYVITPQSRYYARDLNIDAALAEKIIELQDAAHLLQVWLERVYKAASRRSNSVSLEDVPANIKEALCLDQEKEEKPEKKDSEAPSKKKSRKPRKKKASSSSTSRQTAS